MHVVRRIGKHTIRVDCSSAFGLELDKNLLLDRFGSLPTLQLSRKQLLQKLSSGDEYYPISLHWELLDKCNLACPFCYIVGHSSNRVVRFEAIRQHLKDLIDAGLLFCTLTGGEATLHPDFTAIYTYLKSNGVFVELFTNGLLLPDEVFLALQRQKPLGVEVSIYSLDDAVLKQVYKAATEQPAQSVLNNILRLKQVGINVSCKTLATRLTADEVASIAEWCKQNDVRHERSTKIIGAHDGQSLARFSVEAPRTITGNEATISSGHVALSCGTKNYGCALDSSFSLYPCPSIRHRDAYFDVTRLGMPDALTRMKDYIRGHQDLEIFTKGNTFQSSRPCLATAIPVRSKSGRVIFLTAT